MEPRLPALELYEALASISPVHFASYLEVDGFEVVSASPERLIRVEDGRATTRPIAGTRRKGTPEENARFVHELRTSEKERAEHAMLVDLERNDLGRVCAHGSVQVTKLMEIIEYAHVLHIESEVVGRLALGVEPLDVVAAVFPGGTITGVPKIRTMQIISELEPHARGLYTGSLGYVKTADIHHDGRGVFQGMPHPFVAARYHSLVVERASLPDCLEVSAWCGDLVMGLRHREYPWVEGIQFHPESFLTPHGDTLLARFLEARSG